MTTFLPSFSRLDVAAHCIYPWTSGARWPKQPPSGFRGLGQAVSSVAQCLAVWGDAPLEQIAEAEALSPADRAKLARMHVHLRELLEDEVRTDWWRVAEQALGYHLRWGTAREVKQAHPRDYSDQRDGEIIGTPDLVRKTRGGRLVVRDYKTGRYARGKDPAESRQLRALGLAAARAYGADAVVLELAQVDESRVWIERGGLDAFELACCADEVREIYERITGPAEPPRHGRWCTASYCPLRGDCPATRRALEEVARASELRHPLTLEIESAEHAAYVLERLRAIEERVAHLREAVKDYVRDHGPIPIGDGKMWGVLQLDGRERIDLDVDGAVEAIERHLGPFAAATAIERSTSKAALHAAAKLGQTRRGEGVQQVRALLEELRKIGALKTGAPFEKFDEFKAREDDG